MRSTLRPAGADARLDRAQELNPEWEPWIRLLRCAVRELKREPWPVRFVVADSREPAAPLVHDALIDVPVLLARAFVASLLVEARILHDNLPGASAVPGLFEAALRLDPRALDAHAAAWGADAKVFVPIAQLATMPLLHACRRHAERSMPRAWARGYCPLCGAWPTLCEMRGLERERYLRCGRCAAAWHSTVLHCPYCGERDHTALGALTPEGEEETRRVETCRSCTGYVKCLATLKAFDDAELVAADAETVWLDLAAAEHGFARPSRPGYPVRARAVRAGD